MLVLRNRQSDRRLNLRFLRRVMLHLLRAELRVTDFELGFHFVDAEEMARVNWQFLQHTGSTDVITFDYANSETFLHGEAFICVADAMKQAREFHTTWPSEVVRYAVHALLHLQGYDDLQPAKRRVMKREENRLLRALERQFDLAELAGKPAREWRA
jgi:probable rRNA maturation factor